MRYTAPLISNFPCFPRVMILTDLGVCADCKNDKEGYVYCQREQKTLGLTMDGGFSEYMITDSWSAFHIPKEISFVDAAPLMCAGVPNPFIPHSECRSQSTKRSN